MKGIKKLLICASIALFGSINQINAQTDWSLIGNSGSDPAINFIGTTDNKDFVFKRNNFDSGLIGSSNTSLGNKSFLTRLGSENVAFGYNALISTTADANQNIAIGVGALQYFQTGNLNTMIGYRASYSRLEGVYNVGIGNSSGGVKGDNNTFVGTYSGAVNEGFANVYVGMTAGQYSINNNKNVFIGYGAGDLSDNANLNILVGRYSGRYIKGSEYNSIFGDEAGQQLNGSNNNSFFGTQTGYKLAADSNDNVLIGYQSGKNITSGTGNVYLGAYTGLTNAASASKNVFIGYKAGYAETSSNRLHIHNNANNISPSLIYGEFDNRYIKFNVTQNSSSKVEITSSVSGINGTSGLRFTNLLNTNNAIVNVTNKVLSVNQYGDVILVEDDNGDGGNAVTLSCSTENFVPVNSATPNVLECSQIYDNGTSVGIATTGSFDYTWTGGLTGSNLPSTTGTLKLDVNGVTRALAFMATSDKKFKKDIKDLEGALDKVNSLQGKTYHWRKDEFKDKNFTEELQYGFIAQEVQEVLPEIVIKDAKGDLAMNYIALVPILVEAIKQQQNEITETKEELKTLLEDVKSLRNEIQNLKQELKGTEIKESLESSIESNVLKVYPNPSKDEINISFDISNYKDNIQLIIHDINGALLSTINVQKTKSEEVNKKIRKEDYGVGVFIVSVVVEGKIIESKKIIFK